MVSVLQNLTRKITKAKENPSEILKNFLIRNLRGLIRSPISLKRRILEPNQKPLSITKKPHVSNVERKVILQNSAERAGSSMSLTLTKKYFPKLPLLLVDSSDSESSMTGDSAPLQVDELINSDTSVSNDSDSDTKSYLKKINVLTKEQETFLELVKHISDPNLQKEYLDKLLKTLELNRVQNAVFGANPFY